MEQIAVKSVLFDAGNTIVRVNYEIIAAWLEEEDVIVPVAYLHYSDCLARIMIDRQLHRDEFIKHEDFFGRYISKILEGVGVICGKAKERVIEKAIKYHHSHNLWNRINDGVIDLLEALQDHGFLLGVVSNSEGKLSLLLDELGLSPYFTFIIDSTLVGVEKPDPRIFRLALDELALPPEDVIYVGDIYSVDVVGASRAGIDAILLDPVAEWRFVKCRKAKSLGEIQEWVKEKKLCLKD